MPSRRKILDIFSRARLVQIAKEFGMPGLQPLLKEEVVETLAAKRSIPMDRILEGLKRDELKLICRSVSLDDSGKEKAMLIARILNKGKPGKKAPRRTKPPKKRVDKPKKHKQPKVLPTEEVKLVAKKRSKKNNKTTANIGFEQKLWLAADKLRNNMDAAEYKHVILGLIFLKYISDSFESHRSFLVKATADPNSDFYVKKENQRPMVIEDRDEYTAENVFWVPKDARWNVLQKNAKQPTIGKIIDDAMYVIEEENPKLKGILPKRYARPDIDKTRLGELIDLIGTITVGDEESRALDILGRVYEYFLGRFASAEGKGGGEW